jgi:hypothetical protein
MSGSGQLWIQPSGLRDFVPLAAGTFYRQIPTPGVPTQIPAVQGIADCKNLIAQSPPTLLEEFELYSYSIGFAVLAYGPDSDAFTTPPNLTAELALLVNDRVAYITSQTAAGVAINADPANSIYELIGSWTSDLVNPIKLGARDRLSLRVGIMADQANSELSGVIGVQLDPATQDTIPFESTISYNVIDLPASRRL